MPRGAVPGVARNRALRKILADDPAAWWVTCFAVDRRYRSIRVATALLNAAVAHARQHCASAVEGHPVDSEALQLFGEMLEGWRRSRENDGLSWLWGCRDGHNPLNPLKWGQNS